MTAVTTVLPYTGLLRFLHSPKTEIMSENKLCFPLKMPHCCLNLLVLPCGRSFPCGEWCSGWSRERYFTTGMPALCACVQKSPHIPRASDGGCRKRSQDYHLRELSVRRLSHQAGKFLATPAPVFFSFAAPKGLPPFIYLGTIDFLTGGPCMIIGEGAMLCP